MNSLTNLESYKIKYCLYNNGEFLKSILSQKDDIQKQLESGDKSITLSSYILFQSFNNISDIDNSRLTFKKFIFDLYTMGKPSTIKKTLTKEVVEDIVSIFRILYTNKNTLSRLLSDFKKLIVSKEIVEQSVYENIRLTSEEYDSLRNNQTINITEKNLQPQTLNLRVPSINIIENMIRNDLYPNPNKNPKKKIIDLIILLCLASGCRKIEIMKELEFGIDATKQREIIIHKLAKNQSIPPEGIIRPLCFINHTEFMTMIRELRNFLVIDNNNTPLQDIHNEVLGKKYGDRLNRRFKKLFGREATLHDSRDIYGDIAYQNLNNNGISKIHYLQQLFGHSNLETSAHYTACVVPSQS